MKYLLDSNILLRMLFIADPQSPIVHQAIRKLRRQGVKFYILPQNLTEFWNVATRPTTARGGYGKTPQEARKLVTRLLRRIELIDEPPQTIQRWLRLVTQHNVSGVQVHDARLAAGMHSAGITHLLTLNVNDFGRYRNITPIHPQDV